MSSSVGECYFDHFHKYFGQMVHRRVFRQDGESPSIQVLAYDKVFPKCMTFASLGLSHYRDCVGGTLEVFCATDAAWEDVPGALGNALFYAVQSHLPLRAGTVVSGLEKVAPALARAVGKSALYFAEPFGLPAGFERPTCAGADARVLVAIFITEQELALVRGSGPAALETALENAGADPYAIGRPSAV